MCYTAHFFALFSKQNLNVAFILLLSVLSFLGNFSAIKLKWKNMSDCYRRQLQKHKKKNKSGAGWSSDHWKHRESMSFLLSNFEPEETLSSEIKVICFNFTEIF